MNELDKTLSASDNANSNPAATPDMNMENSEMKDSASTVVESPEADQVDLSETVIQPSIVNDAYPSEDNSEETGEDFRRFYAMDKQQLISVLENIVASSEAARHKTVNAIKQAFYTIRKIELENEATRFIEEGNDQSTFSSAPDEAEMRFKDLFNQFKELRAKYLEEEENRRLENLSLKNRILEQMENLVDDIDNINMHTQRFRQLEQEFKGITDIPASATTETWRRFSLLVDRFYDSRKMNKELRDLDFKKNLEIKSDLVARAEALSEETDVIKAFKALQDLHDQWREAGPVAKEIREELWNRFKEASTAVNRRHQDFFEKRKLTEKENEDAKTKLCEGIEAIDLDSLGTFAAWDEATKTIIDMQNRWKAIGFASRKVNNQLFSRFRKSCDDFFSRKAEYFKKTKDEFANNLARKIELCEKAEALKEDKDIDLKDATEKIMALQKEWRTIGSVTRKRSDEVWQRFTSACNYFFDAKKKAAAEVRKDENANLAAKREIIAALKELDGAEAVDEAVATVRELQKKWQTIGHVPFKMKDKIYDEYRGVCDKLYEKFDMRRSRSRMNEFAGQIESLQGDSSKLGRERDRLVRALEQRKNELKTYENNLGFFSIKSSAGNSMLREMERKMQRIKDDMAEIEKKIELLDSKAN